MELDGKDARNGKPENEHSVNKKTSLITKLKDPTYRNVILRWLCLPIATLNLGLIESLQGTTIIDLEIITSTTKSMASLYFTAFNLGYLLGAIISGFLHGKINSYLLMCIVSVVGGIASIGTHYCTTFALMFLIRCALGICLGILLCVINAEHMQIWGTKGESLLQLIHFNYALGGVFGPLIAAPFLAEEITENKTLLHQNLTNYPYGNISSHSDVALNSTLPQTTNVHYAFLIGGLILVVTAIPALLSLIFFRKSMYQIKEIDNQQEHFDRILPLGLKIFFLVIIFWYFLSYCCVEVTFNSYLMTFIVEHFEEGTKQQGAYLTTYYWASFAGGRLISIFTSHYISAMRVLCIHLSLTAAAFIGFFVSSLYSRMDALTALTCLGGLACSAIIPAGVSWTEAEIMKVTGPVTAVIFIGTSTGSMVAPFIVEQLMENVTNLWFCYSILVAIGSALFFFLFLLSFNRCYVIKKYG
uniref:Major facilitator superfamily (MFS) profile domain-containing protein n=1 Tax=Arion vulgaris TaxID=1028688 RepID=A0A0B7AVF3_9EUPU